MKVLIMDIALYLLAIAGLSQIIVNSVLLDPLKVKIKEKGFDNLYYMLNCYQCSGFWSGLFIGLLIFLTKYNPIFLILIYGFAGSFISYGLNYVLDLISACNMYLNKKDKIM